MGILATGCTEKAAKEITNISYGPYDRNYLDAYLPAEIDSNTPVIICIHPGAWMSGDKSILKTLVERLKNSENIVFNINHRFVSDSIHIDDLETDLDRVASCIDSILGNRKKNPVYLLGTSSGGHLALYYGQKNKANLNYKGIIAFAAPNNLLDSNWRNLIDTTPIKQATEWLVGSQYDDTSKNSHQKFIESSPYFHSFSIPIYLFHGDQDPVVPFSMAIEFFEKVKIQHENSRIFTLQGFKHEIGTRDSIVFSKVVDSINQWIRVNG